MAETIIDSNASSPLPILPLEIIGEILIRLPVKSLMRFKCVCKSWRFLISEPCFALKHAETWEAMMAEDVPLGVREDKSRGHCQRLRQYGVVTTSQYKLKSCCVQSLFNEKFAGVEVHDNQLLGRDYYHLVGTCHGLICFHTDHKHMYLWNPTLKLHSIWPGSFLETGSGESVTYGFGYDQSHGDYRVVALLHQRRQNMTEAKVYSVKHGRWRSTGMCFPSGIVAEKTRPGIYINGTLNWAAANLSSSSSTIVSYKLSHDVFEELPQPVCTKGCFMMTLGNLGGCLSMVCYCQKSKASVWVMKEFGEGESWMKLVSIPGLTEYARPLWISNEDEVLFEFRSGLGLYNCGNGMFKYPVADSLSSCRNVKVYVKTMVSPNAS